MLVGLYSAATGLMAAERNHEVTAENLAHVSVPGYRAQIPSSQTFELAMAGQMPTPSPEGHGTAVTIIQSDFSPGPLQQTGRSLDLALGGDGFFEVMTPEGPRYTRNGVFFASPDGELINTEGWPVSSTSGKLTLPPNVSPEQVTVASDGQIRAQGQAVGQIKVVKFPDNAKLYRAGTTLFAPPQGVRPEETEAVPIIQGAREMSNVSAVSELVRMIVGTRHYEASQKVLKTLDEAIGLRTSPQS